VAPSRKNRKSFTTWQGETALSELCTLSHETGKSQQRLVAEALNLMLTKYGKRTDLGLVPVARDNAPARRALGNMVHGAHGIACLAHQCTLAGRRGLTMLTHRVGTGIGTGEERRGRDAP
jgi:hypothetical protein